MGPPNVCIVFEGFLPLPDIAVEVMCISSYLSPLQTFSSYLHFWPDRLVTYNIYIYIIYRTSCVLCVYHIILSLTLSILLRLRPSHRRVFDVFGRWFLERLESLEPLRWIRSFKATRKETSLYTIKYQDFLKVILIALILLIFFPYL